MTLVPKESYRTLEWHWYNKDKIKQDILDYEQSQLDASGHQICSEDVGHGIGKHGDPTAIIASNMVDGGPMQIRQYRKWLAVLDKVKRSVEGTDKEALIRMFYEQGLGYRKTAEKMGVSVPSFYDKKEELIYTTYTVAIEDGLMRALNN